MARYRLLAQHYAGLGLLEAGQIITEGVEVPNGFAPTPYCEPLDQDAANKFFAQGVKLPGLIRSVWERVSIPPPVTFWKPDPNAAPGNPNRQFILSGPFGVGLGFAQIGVVGTGAAP